MNPATAKSPGREPQPKAPADLRKALGGAPAAKAAWADLTAVARRDFISWIDAAKQTETRKRRIERACDMLASGKRRPCCFAIVPLDFHNALKAAPAAKRQWSVLTSHERRDLIDWINEAEQRDMRRRRIDRVCASLSAGKRGKV